MPGDKLDRARKLVSDFESNGASREGQKALREALEVLREIHDAPCDDAELSVARRLHRRLLEYVEKHVPREGHLRSAHQAEVADWLHVVDEVKSSDFCLPDWIPHVFESIAAESERRIAEQHPFTHAMWLLKTGRA